MSEQSGVTFAFGGRVGGFRVDVVHRFEGLLGEDAVAEELSERLRGVGIDADVFVHVECVDARPVDLFQQQVCEEIVLRGGRGEDDVHFGLRFQQRTDVCAHLAGGHLAQFGAGFGDRYFESSFGQSGYHVVE